MCILLYGYGIWVVSKTYRKALKASDEDEDEDEVLLKTDVREELVVDLVRNTHIR